MTADIVNLRKARKTKARAEAAILAAENRVKFGRSKAECARDEAATQRLSRTLDGAKQSPGSNDSGEDKTS